VIQRQKSSQSCFADKRIKNTSTTEQKSVMVQTLGGTLLRRTIRVCEIKFEKRGPMATYSSNLNDHTGAAKNTSIKKKCKDKWHQNFVALRYTTFQCHQEL
jgi:hypothetical protein